MRQAHSKPPASGDRRPFWGEPADSLIRALGSSPQGLSTADAEERRARFGPNAIAARRRRPLAVEVLLRFQNPLVLLLLAASVLSAATGDRASFAIITTVVVLSVVLDFVQEHRAGQAADRLRRSVAVRATVRRDGRLVEMPTVDVVPGDVVALSAGSLVPADGVLLEARDLFVNQALLTGEAYPVEKRPGAGDGDSPGTAENAVFMGSSVLSGSGSALIVRTGAQTAVGEIGETLHARPPETAFEAGTRSFGLFLLRTAILMVLFVLLVNTVRGQPRLESFLFALALAVGLTPELLPMIASVTLARGAVRMAANQVVVKRLAAIHDLGSMTVLCTDKTGTLTEARIRLERHLDPSGRDSPRVLRLAYLNSTFESGIQSPLDEAILRHSEVDISGCSKIDEVPFDFERRRVSVLVGGDVAPCAPLLVVKGAFEDILRLSTHYEAGSFDELCPLTDAAREELQLRSEDLAREGYRVLGLAWRSEPPDCVHAQLADEAELVFAGFLAFEDPPKASAGDALRELAANGVAVKVVTGDNEIVTRHVCSELALPIEGVLTGAEIQHLDDLALAARAVDTTLFCRVTPAQKSRIILALRRRGAVVGYLGDGINDAPPLHSAHVGISVDDAVDVAKEAADLILLEPDLTVLQRGVIEGRRTFGNIMKYVMMATSSNFGNMFSMAGASVFLPFLPMLPVQILLNNLLYDVSEIPIPLDEIDEQDLRRPRRWDMGFVRNFMVVVGSVSSLFDFLTFYVLLRVMEAGAAEFRTGWFVESIATQVLVIFVIRTRKRPWQSLPNPLLAATSLAVVAGALVLTILPVGGWLGFVALPPSFVAMLALLTGAYLAMVEVVKQRFYRARG